MAVESFPPTNYGLRMRCVEIEFMLRDPIRSPLDLAHVTKDTSAGLAFMADLEKAAARVDMQKGALISLILPFGSDQSANKGQTSNLQDVLKDMPSDIRSGIGDKEVANLVRGANRMRRLVRVKVRHIHPHRRSRVLLFEPQTLRHCLPVLQVADDNDLDQAKESLELALKFFRDVEAKATREKTKPITVLRALRRPEEDALM